MYLCLINSQVQKSVNQFVAKFHSRESRPSEMLTVWNVEQISWKSW